MFTNIIVVIIKKEEQARKQKLRKNKSKRKCKTSIYKSCQSWPMDIIFFLLTKWKIIVHGLVWKTQI